MDTFFVLMFLRLAATACANSGYNYQQPRPAVNQVFRPSPPFGSNAAAAALAPPINSQYLPPAPAPQYLQPQFTPSPQFVSAPSQYIAPVQQAPPQYNELQQRQTIVSSNIYIHSAPDETEEITAGQNSEVGPIRKNYRILFVRAPTHNIRFNLNSFKQAQAANEEKTIIYVLTKKPEVSNFQSQLSALQPDSKTHKPEVYFIKYKTPEEANRAQQEIQAQYDALGGSTNVSDEGFAPVTSVIGGGPVNGGGNFLQSAGSSPQNFIQPPFPGNQESASSVGSIGVAVPNLRYLPSRKKY